MIEAIRLALPETKIQGYPGTCNLLHFRKINTLWLNWYENTSQKENYKDVIKKVVSLVIIRSLGTKIIATFHNKRPHDVTQNWLSKFLFWFVFKFSNRIIILSKDSIPLLKKIYGEEIENKLYLIPHPTYDCKPKKTPQKDDKFRVLYFGLIRPYKNIEILLRVIKDFPKISFTIAGKSSDEKYLSQLKNSINSLPNVNLIPHFLSDEEIDELIQENSVIVLPYDTNSSLNSGAVVHALCKRINVIVPEIGTINMLKNRTDVYSYSYSNEKQHITNLKAAIERAKCDFEENIEEFNNKAERLYKEVLLTQSVDTLQQNIRLAFTF